MCISNGFRFTSASVADTMLEGEAPLVLPPLNGSSVVGVFSRRL